MSSSALALQHGCLFADFFPFLSHRPCMLGRCQRPLVGLCQLQRQARHPQDTSCRRQGQPPKTPLAALKANLDHPVIAPKAKKPIGKGKKSDIKSEKLIVNVEQAANATRLRIKGHPRSRCSRFANFCEFFSHLACVKTTSNRQQADTTRLHLCSGTLKLEPKKLDNLPLPGMDFQEAPQRQQL